MTETETLTDAEEMCVHGIQALMHANLATAINNINEGNPKLKGSRIQLVLPIALSRLVYRELLILSDYHGFPIDQWHDLFAALLNDLVANKVDLYKLNASIKRESNGK